jgi:hypothetical protein
MRALRASLILSLGAIITLVVLGLAGTAFGQTNPPALGDGDWNIQDDTVIRDWDVIMLRGDLLVTNGGSLELINSTLLFVNSDAGEHGLTVNNGGTLRVLDGATVGSSRPNVPITFVVEAGCTLEIRDSFIEEVGMPAFGLRPEWREISMYIGTADATIEGSTFTGGLAGPFFDEGVLAPPVRNCTFENVYGVISYGVGIEDCTFRNQNIYGVVFHGGNTGYVARCTFESVFATCINIGFEYFEPYELHPAEANVRDCTFYQSTRAIRVLDQSASVITNCSIDSMEREGIVALNTSRVHIWDGSVNNTFDAIACGPESHMQWTVSTRASVRGGSVTLSGNLTLLKDARLDLSDFRELTMLSFTPAPLWFNLHQGSVLSLTRGSVEIPLPGTTPETSTPIRLGPDPSNVRGSLFLEEVDVLEVKDRYHLRELRAVSSTVPIGKTSVEVLYLEDCLLVPDVRTSVTELTLGGSDALTECSFVDCELLGIDRIPSAGPWLVVRSAKVHSYDFLYDLDEMIDKGAVVMVGGDGGPSQFQLWWSAQTHVIWQNHVPIQGVMVEVITQTSSTYSSMTDGHGDTVDMEILTEEITDKGVYASHIPLTFRVNVSGLVEDTVVDTVVSRLHVDLMVVDLIPPMLMLDGPSQVATNNTNYTLSGRIIDEHSGVAFLEVAMLPADYIRVPLDKATGRFEHTIVLRKGYQSIAVRGYDSVGNRRVKLVETFYSIEPPYVAIDEPVDGAWVNTNLTFIIGVTEVGATVELQGRITEAVNGSFRIPAYLVEGPNLLTVNATSRAGNHNSTQVLVYLDTREPSLEIFDPTQESYHRIRGRAEPGALVFVNQVPVDVDEDGTFVTSQVNLDEGSTKITLWAVDDAGNENITEVVFVLDSQPPSLIVLVAGEDATLYTGDDPFRTSGETVSLTVITDEDAMLRLDGEEYTLMGTGLTVEYPLVSGRQTISVTVEDPAGNSFEFDPIHVEVDWVPPKLRLDQSMPNETEETLLNLKGYTEPNCTITVNGVRLSVDTSGAFVRNFLLNEGMNTLVVVSTDDYGQKTTLVYEVKMVAPEPEPWPDATSLFPMMLALTIVLLVVEAVLLQLYWRRKREENA